MIKFKPKNWRKLFPLATAMVLLVAFPSRYEDVRATLKVSNRAVVRYKINAGGSTFTVRTSSGGLFSMLGHNHTIAIRDFAGDVELAPGALEQSGLHMTVKANSLALMDKVDEKERSEIERTMREQVLEVGKYSEIDFHSTGVTASKSDDKKFKAKISGDLTLHGIKRNIPVQVLVTMDGNSLKAVGEFSVRQTDFGIKPVSAAGGTIKVKDEVKLSFNILASESR
jgi:polyisoprenoid-binding protein YceI